MTRPDKQAVLLLRLAGPLQSWGTRSQYNRRDTASEPSKSGLVGLLAAALGRDRSDDISDLAALRLGVRADQPGSLLRDYHTVSDYRGRRLLSAETNKKGEQKPTSPAKETAVTQRFYLQDAVFLAAFLGPSALLENVDGALRAPAFPLALGRRSCPPTLPVTLGVRPVQDETNALRETLTSTTWLAGAPERDKYQKRAADPTCIALVSVIEDPRGAHSVTDVPLSFHPLRRGLTDRQVDHRTLTVPTGLAAETPPTRPGRGGDPGHDPFALLGW